MTTPNSPYPSAYDQQKADEIWAKLTEITPEELKFSSGTKDMAHALFGNSPFLSTIAERFPEFTCHCLVEEHDCLWSNIKKELLETRPQGETQQELMTFLRTTKAKVALLTAVADLTRSWELDKVTEVLSSFADLSLQLGLAHLMHNRMAQGELAWPKGSPEPVSHDLCQKTGYFVLGMGKLGANELNYSSDIDLIVFYDSTRIVYTGRKSLSSCYIKITQELMHIIENRTMHGYVFRTDLRLRPDPGATPAAITIEAAENYYHSMAVNWERSAMIKARVVAGDFEAGEQFLKTMTPWIWRKNMDFAALDDIAAIKNQINRHYDQQADHTYGYNVKLGFGGIREIEFFAQINQLLHAGRHPELRIRGTLRALHLLEKLHFLSREDMQALEAAYIFLRTLEHRLQMIDDAQTHSLPDTEEAMQHVACFMGYSSPEQLLTKLKNHTAKVSQLYDTLMPDAAESSTARGYAETELENTLHKLSFNDIGKAMDIISGWRRGRHRALRTERAKKLLELCLPGLLEAFSTTHSADDSLIRFDSFIAQQPAGVQLFSLLHSNPSLFKLLARVLGLAPALADTLGKKPSLWDMVLEPNFFAPMENEDTLSNELSVLLSGAQDFQDILDFVRKYAAEQKFRTGVHILESLSGIEETGIALSTIADVCVKALVPAVCKEFSRRHGTFKGGGIAIVAMGKYGGKELTHTSDLDIVFLYYVEDMKASSNGDKPLTPSQYFSRLGQNIITAITALTPEGRLYEVDTRLRPSGSQGPLVVTLKTFEEYYTNSAWTWEHMALTRARVITAPTLLHDKLTATIQTVLTQKRDAKALLIAVAEMREKLNSGFGTKNIWDIKHTRGGLVDMEFICQYLMLREGSKHDNIFHATLQSAIKHLKAKDIVHEADAALLLKSHSFQQKVQSVLRLCLLQTPQSSDEISAGLKEIMNNATEKESFTELEKELKHLQMQTYNLYKKLIETPANSYS